MDEDLRSPGASSPKVPTKSVSWASSVNLSSDSSEEQEIIALNMDLKESMQNNIQ